MTKNELYSAVAMKADCKVAEVNSVLDAFISVMTEELVKGEKVAINGLGIFEPKARDARIGINPKTGEKINIAASKSIGFKPAKAVKDILNA